MLCVLALCLCSWASLCPSILLFFAGLGVASGAALWSDRKILDFASLVAVLLATGFSDLCSAGSCLWMEHWCQMTRHWHKFLIARACLWHPGQTMPRYPFDILSCMCAVSLACPHAVQVITREL